jgi:hypothetical protein
LTNELTVGREPLQIVEIAQPKCSLSYGVSPCTAAVGTTGEQKCFNTSISCQDPINYTPDEHVVWRFIKPSAPRPPDLYEVDGGTVKLDPIPILASVTTSPTKINVGGGDRNARALGIRASGSAVFQDTPYDDTGADPYLDSRNYIATDRGTFWGKWLARNPYYNNLEINVYDGYRGQTLAEMQRRTYLIRTIDGPDSSGRVTIRFDDPLRLADDTRALVPPPVDLRLRDAINSSQTTDLVLIGIESEISRMIGNTGSTRYLIVDDEIISYTGFTEVDDNEWSLSGVSRSALGTEPEDHEADEQVGRVARWESIPVWELQSDLITNYTPVPSEFIPLAQWAAEGVDFLGTFQLTGTIVRPTPVVNILGETCEQALNYLYWDDRAQLIKMRAIRPPVEAPMRINEFSNIIEDSAVLKTDPDQRISRVIIYYLPRNPTQEGQPQNYQRAEVRVDGSAESADQFNESRTRQIFSRWLTSQAQAQEVVFRLLSRYRNNPRFLTIRLDAKDRSLWTADPVDVTTKAVQDLTGASPETRWQVISAEEILPGEVVQYDLQTLEFIGRFGVWMNESAPDYSALTPTQRDGGGVGFWADEDGLMPDGGDGYQWQ